jgi:predicted ArsR family transcriptional regulator
MLRYQESNELHMDFHGTTNTTLDYIADNYGVEALKEILRKTGRDVYKSIHEKLVKGDASELVEHLNWFFFREKGKYQLTVDDDRIVFEVFECPALRHLKKLGLEPSKHLCLQTSEVNAGMCEGSPWESSVEVIGEGHCIQTFSKKKLEK